MQKLQTEFLYVSLPLKCVFYVSYLSCCWSVVAAVVNSTCHGAAAAAGLTWEAPVVACFFVVPVVYLRTGYHSSSLSRCYSAYIAVKSPNSEHTVNSSDLTRLPTERERESAVAAAGALPLLSTHSVLCWNFPQQFGCDHSTLQTCRADIYFVVGPRVKFCVVFVRIAIPIFLL